MIGPDTITAIRAWQSAQGLMPGRLRHRLAAAGAALMAERPPRLAVLIDADNTSPKVADGLFDEVAKIGEASLRRIYGDFSKGQQAGWEKVLARHAILAAASSSPTPPARTRPTSRWSSTRWTCCTPAGSTASASSPPTATSPGSPRASASRGSTSTASARRRRRRASARPAPASSSPRTSSPSADSGRRRPRRRCGRWPRRSTLIVKAIEQIEEDAEGWFQLGTVGQRLTNLSPEFDTRTFGHAKLSDLVEATGRFEIDRAGQHVRMRPKQGPGANAEPRAFRASGGHFGKSSVTTKRAPQPSGPPSGASAQ